MRLHVYHGQSSPLSVLSIASRRIYLYQSAGNIYRLQSSSGNTMYYIEKDSSLRCIKIVSSNPNLIFFYGPNTTTTTSLFKISSNVEQYTVNGVTTYTVQVAANNHLFITYEDSSRWYGINPDSAAIANWWFADLHKKIANVD